MKNSFDQQKISAIREGGKKLAAVKHLLVEHTHPGVHFEELEKIAWDEIIRLGAKPSFPTVDGYKYATCITKNEGCCHGVPVGKTVEDGDVITLDLGLIWNGYHTDTTETVYVHEKKKADPKIEEFLRVGRLALDKAISKAQVGNSVWDISHAIEKTISEHGYEAVYQLTGHAVGKHLHEDPQIPCVAYRSDKKIPLVEGMTLAIEPMYAMGNARLVLGGDGWTYETADKSLTGMFEDTVIVTSGEPEIVTRVPNPILEETASL
ncbi:MAG TPA: type I methionyl aminopeptidase [Patescibacteria group bacterium]|nr:type I methionyl aminopeptidase [Patescibacteria group bacterium]